MLSRGDRLNILALHKTLPEIQHDLFTLSETGAEAGSFGIVLINGNFSEIYPVFTGECCHEGFMSTNDECCSGNLLKQREVGGFLEGVAVPN